MADEFDELRRAADEQDLSALRDYLANPAALGSLGAAPARRRSRWLRSPLLAVYAAALLILPAMYVGSGAVAALYRGASAAANGYAGSDRAYPAVGGGGGGGGGGSPCTGTPGAPGGSSTTGYHEYTTNQTISNTIFNASHSDDLVDVTAGHVIFDHVTFQGTGTGDSGSTLEVSGSGSVEVRNSKFEGAPTEDYIQTKSASTSTESIIECNVFEGPPGEDDIDMKTGGPVTVRNNTINDVANGGDTFIVQNSTDVLTIENNSGPGMASIFFTNGASDAVITNNTITAGDSTLWVYDVSNVLIENNTVGVVKNGESGTSRSPAAVYYLNNRITTFQFNGGSCYRTGNTGASLTQCTNAAPSWYTP